MPNGGGGMPHPIDCPNGNCGDGTKPIFVRCTKDPDTGDVTCPGGVSPGDPTTPTTPTTPPANNVCSSTSPEFCTLANTLNNQVAAGAPITPYLQDNTTPTVVPTQTQGSKMTGIVVLLFAVAGAAGYYYYRKHGGPSVHEAL